MVRFATEVEREEFCGKVKVGLAAMTPEDKVSMYQRISEALNNMSDEDKAERAKKISESVHATNVARNLLIETPVVPRGFGEWFTGFSEGDISVCSLLNMNNLGSGYVFKPEIEFAQKDSDVVEYIASVLLDGDLGWTERKQGLYRQLRWSGQKKCIPVLKLLSCFVVTEALQYRLNTALYQLQLPLACLHPLTMLWVVGFWDAEGSAEEPNGPSVITFYQKDCSVLELVQGLLGRGAIYTPDGCSRLVVSGKKGRRLAVELLQYSRIERKKDMLRRRFGLEYG